MLSSFMFLSNTHRVCSKCQPSVQLGLITMMLWETREMSRCGKSISILKRYLSMQCWFLSTLLKVRPLRL